MPVRSEGPVLTKRALNRALLARQMLLARAKARVLEAVEQLSGMQAQVARPPFIGLWTRLEKFAPSDLLGLIKTKKVVRATTLRGTIHLMSTADFIHFRPRLSTMLIRGAMSVVGKRLGGNDIAPFVKAGRDYFAKNAAPFEDFRDVLEAKFPKLDIRAVAYAARMNLALVMVPEDGERWGYSSSAPFTLADKFLGKKVPDAEDGLETVVLRYLAAFGPATPGDAQAWSGLRDLRPVFETLRPRLVTFRDERKRELFDLPKAPRPDEDTPAPVRFLPDYDNISLAHDDRSRIIADAHRGKLVTRNLIVLGGITVDGFIAGTWRVDVKKKAAELALTPFGKLPKGADDEIATEGERLLKFLEPDAEPRVVKFVK